MKTVGDKFPAFSLQGINEKNEFVQVNVDEGYTPHKKDWSVVYFYPKDFTFICPTEIAGMDVEMIIDYGNINLDIIDMEYLIKQPEELLRKLKNL